MAAKRVMLSLRVRLVLMSTGVVSIALVVGAVVLLAILRSSLERGVTNTALTRAADVASLAEAGTLPASLAFPGEERSIIQVIDAGGRVVASTGNIVGEPALGVRVRGPYTDTGLPIGDQERLRMTVRAVDTDRGRYLVVSGESLARVDETVRIVQLSLEAGLPLLVLMVAVLVWRSARRTLRPVEAIRAEVADITETDLHRRVPEPDGRDEIAHLATTMNGMLDRLEAASMRQARFVSDASHELRTPLTVLRTVLEIGLRRPDRLDWPARAESALVEVEQLERLVRDLLTLGSTQVGQIASWPRCDLAAIVAHEVDRCASDARVRLSSGGGGQMWVRGDGEQLGRAISNLLANAIRHSRATVTVTLAIGDVEHVLEVSDDGPGVVVADRERIFERFVRLDDARAVDEGGSGLGLAIVRSIVTGHGGTVGVVAGPPGATFRIMLPAMQPPPPFPTLAASNSSGSTARGNEDHAETGGEDDRGGEQEGQAGGVFVVEPSCDARDHGDARA